MVKAITTAVESLDALATSSAATSGTLTDPALLREIVGGLAIIVFCDA
jgi:hypothetical protein